MLNVFQGLPSSAVDDSRGRITLRNVAREDAGDYICSAVGISGTFQSTVRLEVDYSKSAALLFLVCVCVPASINC